MALTGTMWPSLFGLEMAQGSMGRIALTGPFRLGGIGATFQQNAKVAKLSYCLQRVLSTAKVQP
jgi:hypothetical protein